jgi:hypothetical protein
VKVVEGPDAGELVPHVEPEREPLAGECTPENCAEWIVAYVTRNNGHIRGRCQEASVRMVEAFPVLRVVAGFVTTPTGFRSEHFWCETPNDDVVDPTALQFGCHPNELTYQKFEPGDEIRVGTCMNCGEPIHAPAQTLGEHNRKEICSEACEKEFGDYLSRTDREMHYP